MAHPQSSFAHTSFSPISLAGRRREAAFSNTLRYQLAVLKGTGRYDAFKLQWHSSYEDPPTVWPIPNHLFWDSDIAKWIEGACYFLRWKYDAHVDGAVQDLVEKIRNAQQADGYINIHFTVVEPGKRFTNLRDFHELYNAGHLIEAALAHKQLYQNNRLLDPIITYVNLLCDIFGPGPDQIHGYPGHPEIELALLRLYKVTKEPKHLSLARYFLTERGNPIGVDGRHYFEEEARRRGDDPNARPVYYTEEACLWYYQAHKPIAQQDTIEGHAVRAMYLLTAVADLVNVKGEQQHTQGLKDAVYRLWNNMVGKKMYMTGGIGAIKQYEGFGLDYFLPQGTDEGGCYSETCAAIGVMMLAERLLQHDLNGEIADIMELCFYNACLSGMSCDGKKFTYVNQLASSDTDLSAREEWFTCSCCPPNILRLLGYLGGYLWTFKVGPQEKDEESASAQINVHMFSSAALDFAVGESKVVLEQATDWPWSGDVDFTLTSGNIRTTINLRIPGWASHAWTLSPIPPKEAHLENGYVSLPASWLQDNPRFRLSIPLTPRLLSPHPYTNKDTVTVARGPIIYCAEDVDNPWVTDHFKSVLFDPESQITESHVIDDQTQEPYVALRAEKAITFLDTDALSKASPGFSSSSTTVTSLPVQQQEEEEGDTAAAAAVSARRKAKDLHLIPYYFHASRGGKGHMRVGLRHWRRK